VLEACTIRPVPGAVLLKPEKVATPFTRFACVPVKPPFPMKEPAVLARVTVPVALVSSTLFASTAWTLTEGPLGSPAVPVISVLTTALAGCVTQTSLQVLPARAVTRLLSPV
jgi:hypothetical protein